MQLEIYQLFDDLPPRPMRREMVPNADRAKWQFWKPMMRPMYWATCGELQEDGSILWPEG